MLSFYHSFEIKKTLCLPISFRNHDLKSELVILHEEQKRHTEINRAPPIVGIVYQYSKCIYACILNLQLISRKMKLFRVTNFCSKNVAFTKFLSKNRELFLHCAVNTLDFTKEKKLLRKFHYMPECISWFIAQSIDTHPYYFNNNNSNL